MFYRLWGAQRSDSKADVYRDKYSFQNNCCNCDIIVCVSNITGQIILANWWEITWWDFTNLQYNFITATYL